MMKKWRQFNGKKQGKIKVKEKCAEKNTQTCEHVDSLSTSLVEN